jgi:type IV pilus assembly protein PilO
MNAAELIRQWRDLNGRHPATWPRAWRNALLLTLFLAVQSAGWQLCLAPAIDTLEQSELDYATLKSTYPEKYRRAMTFAHSTLRAQRLEQAVATLEQQLETHSGIDPLLDIIGDAALQNRLQFEFARPGRPETKNGYVEAPIAIRLSGNYHDIGRFAADIAATARLVILSDMRLSSADRSGRVTLEALALAYRRNPGGEEKS